MNDNKETIEKVSIPSDEENSKKWITEALFVIGGTATFYLATYSYQKAYLTFFGVSDSFVEISTKSLVTTGVAPLFGAVFIWNTLGVFTPNFALVLSGLLIILLPFAVSTYLAYLIWDVWGFNFWFLLVFLLAIFFFVMLIRSFFRARREEKSLADWVFSIMKSIVVDNDQSFQARAHDKLGSSNIILLLFIYIFVQVLAPYWGNSAARSRLDFSVIDIGLKRFAIISEYNSGHIAVEIGDSKDEFLMNKSSIWISQEVLSLKAIDLVKISPLGRSNRIYVHRKTFPEFWSSIFRVGEVEDRR